jgi:hypothetical protein
MAQQEVLTFKGIADCLQKERGYLHAYVSITKAKEAFLSKKTETNGSNWVIRTTLSSIVCSKTGRLRALYYSCGMLMVRRWPGGRWVEEVERAKEVHVDIYKQLWRTNGKQLVKEMKNKCGKQFIA